MGPLPPRSKPKITCIQQRSTRKPRLQQIVDEIKTSKVWLLQTRLSQICNAGQMPPKLNQRQSKEAPVNDFTSNVQVCILNYTKEGKPFWNQLCLSPIRDRHGVAFYLGIQTNVTGPVLAYRSQQFSPFQNTAIAGQPLCISLSAAEIKSGIKKLLEWLGGGSCDAAFGPS